MRIAFLNPWRDAAENQCFSSLCIAASRVGHELVHCSNSAEVDHCAPDFVLATSDTQPKLSDAPHYGAIHTPRERFLTNRAYFHNLLSYDGYLTITDTLDRFVHDVTFGAGRERPAGFFYITGQRQEHSADLRSLIDRRALRITYFGTNWDQRRQSFFKMLSESEGVQIYGPERSWTHINKKGYGGAIPFDGVGVQARYAVNGIGLCLLSDAHLRDDVISNRIFEVCSVGALALSCDLPWIRKHFGDSVYYFDQNLDDCALQRAILDLREAIYRDPEEAIAKATRAREIFETKFAAEVMIENAVRYHQQLTSARSSMLQNAEKKYSPLISVIVRCGSRPIKYVRRAFESIARQTYGRFEVIFVRYQNLDLTPLCASESSRIVSIRVVDCMGGNRSATLWAGLNAVSGEYFSVLDDDDWWFSNHFEVLFHPLPESPLKKFMAYSGAIAERSEPVPIEGGQYDVRELDRFGIESVESWDAVTFAFASNCFVASSDLLHSRLLVCPCMETGEDSYLILSLLAQVEPRFSYAVTSVADQSLTGHSDFLNHPRRFEDLLTIQLRLLLRDRPSFVARDYWKTLSEYWARWTLPPDPQTILRDWLPAGEGCRLSESTLCRGSRVVDPRKGSATIEPPPEPWAYGAELCLQRSDRECPGQHVLIAELLVRTGAAGVGILNLAGNDFLFRQCLTAYPRPQTVSIAIQDIRQAGRFVVQNWEAPGKTRVELISIRLMAKPSTPAWGSWEHEA